jgi:phage shock protein A
MAADAERKGDATKSAQLTSAAETIATQLIQAEKDVGDLKALVLQTTQASDQAKAAVQQNSRVLQQKLAERAKLLSQLEQAKMQEQMNKAMATLNEAVGEDVPTLGEVRNKIEPRPRPWPSSTRVRSTPASGRSRRPPPTPRPRPACPS